MFQIYNNRRIYQKQMKPQAMNIIKMISKPLNQRMPFEGVQLTKFVQKLPFFKRFFPYQSQKFISLCLSSYLREIQQGENLYKNQQKPDLIYIIVDGSIRVELKDSCIKRDIHSYDIIGHVQVVFKMKQRGQNAIALSHTYCMVIKEEHFKNVWEKQEQIEKAYHYLSTNKYFQPLSVFDKKSLSLLMIKNSFRQGQMLSISGSVNDKIFLIIYGQIYVIKKLRVHGTQKQIILQSLQQMDSFGEYQSIEKIISEVTLRAASSGTYYSIMVSQALQIKHPFVQLVKQKAVPYPDKEELQFRFQVQAKVEKYKNEVKKKLNLYK